MRLLVQVHNPTETPQKTFTIHFAPTRSVFFRIEPETLLHSLTFAKVSESTFVVTLLGKELAPNEAITLAFEYQGEPVSVPTVSFDAVEAAFALSEEQARFALPLSVDEDQWMQTLNARFGAIESIEQPDFRTASIFFAEYDHQTFPPLVRINNNIPQPERQFRLFVIQKLADILAQRVQMRGRDGQLGQVPDVDELKRIRFVTPEGTVNEPTNLDEIRYLSQIQRQIYERNYGSPVDAEACGEAFELFVNGEIRFIGGVRNAEPDSAFEFSFAEFALAALDFAVDVEFWSPLLPHLIRCQQIFTTVYNPDGVEMPRYQDYKPANFSPTKQVSNDVKRHLREAYNSLSIAELTQRMGRHAFEAFRGDYTQP